MASMQMALKALIICLARSGVTLSSVKGKDKCPPAIKTITCTQPTTKQNLVVEQMAFGYFRTEALSLELAPRS